MLFIKKIIDGKLLRGEEIQDHIRRAKDGLYSIVIKKYGSRSNMQNSFYRLCLTILERETGTPKEDLHIFLKIKFLGEVNGRPSTTEQNIEEMSEYIEKVINYSAEQGIILPEAIS